MVCGASASAGGASGSGTGDDSNDAADDDEANADDDDATRKAALEKLGAGADGKLVSQMVKQRLSGG